MVTHSIVLAWKIPPGQRSLEGYSPWGHKESDMTERLYNSNNIRLIVDFTMAYIYINQSTGENSFAEG